MALRSCTLAMDADEVVESDEPRSNRQKLTDFFERLPSSSQPQACYLRRFQPTDVLRRRARPVGTEVVLIWRQARSYGV